MDLKRGAAGSGDASRRKITALGHSRVGEGLLRSGGDRDQLRDLLKREQSIRGGGGPVRLTTRQDRRDG